MDAGATVVLTIAVRAETCVNPESVKDVLQSIPVRVLFQAAAQTARSSKSQAINELAKQLGCKPATLWNFLRRRTANRLYYLQYIVCNQPAGLVGCDHRYVFVDPRRGYRLCVRCLANNFPDHHCWRHPRGPKPKREPSKVYRPGELKGGMG